MEPITHLQDKKRFEITEDGYTAYVAYELFEGGIDITHTLVPKPLEGRGLASALVKHVLEYAGGQTFKSASYLPVCKGVCGKTSPIPLPDF
jgi:Predicted acetyltransferase